MARIVAIFDDLLLGSNVMGMLRADGHEAVLLGSPPTVRDSDVDLTIVDLNAGTFDGAAEFADHKDLWPDSPTLGVYSHVDHETKERAVGAGMDLVVPRSRLMREGPQLIARLLAG